MCKSRGLWMLNLARNFLYDNSWAYYNKQAATSISQSVGPLAVHKHMLYQFTHKKLQT
jgi:hypothetical protein